MSGCRCSRSSPALCFPWRCRMPRRLKSALAKKLRRIGIPFVVVSTPVLSDPRLLHAGGGPALPIWQIYLLPYEHYWYLQATLLIMAFVLARRHFVPASTPGCCLDALLPIAVVDLPARPDLRSGHLRARLGALPAALFPARACCCGSGRLDTQHRRCPGDGAASSLRCLALTARDDLRARPIASVEGASALELRPAIGAGPRASACRPACSCSSCAPSRSRCLELCRRLFLLDLSVPCVLHGSPAQARDFASGPNCPHGVFFAVALAAGHLPADRAAPDHSSATAGRALLLLGIDISGSTSADKPRVRSQGAPP